MFTIKHYLLGLTMAAGLCHTVSADWEETPYGKYWTGAGKPEPVSALKGTFYDFRYKANGKEQHPDIPKHPDTWWNLITVRSVIINALHEMIKGKKTELSKLLRFDGHVYASHFYIPARNKECITKHLPSKNQIAYETEGEESDFITEKPKIESGLPGGWVAVYRGKIRAPKSGKFRFVGTADDCIIVRFANRMVLEAGYTVPSSIEEGNKDSIWNAAEMGISKTYHQKIRIAKDPIHSKYEFLRLKSTPKLNDLMGGFMAGTPFNVKKGSVYPIEIILMDAINDARFFLMIQELRKDGKLAPLHLFRTDDTLPNSTLFNPDFEKPDFAEDSLIWEVAND